ncbi:MAG: barstar family protein [Gallionellaceae bacterium]|nr:barstar family protein [Gallionellaceae bacterium]
MNGLCARLMKVEEAGVYRLNCTLDELLDGADVNGFAVFEANFQPGAGKGEVLAEMARVIKAPDWFGHNWDALIDSLCDLSWRPAPGYVLLLRGEVPPEKELHDIFEAVVTFWKTQGKPFWIFFI